MKDVSNATAYAVLVPQLMEAGREVGYAVALHGSWARDLDLVAIPWTEEAVSAERLVMHLMAAVDGHLLNGSRCTGKDAEGKEKWEDAPASVPDEKPHGRLAWVIRVGHGSMYLDVSVMPRRPPVTSSSSPTP